MKKQVIIQAIKWTGTEESIKELDEFMVLVHFIGHKSLDC